MWGVDNWIAHEGCPAGPATQKYVIHHRDFHSHEPVTR